MVERQSSYGQFTQDGNFVILFLRNSVEILTTIQATRVNVLAILYSCRAASEIKSERQRGAMNRSRKILFLHIPSL